MTSDGNDNVWFVEQQTGKIGTIKMTEIPVSSAKIQSQVKIIATNGCRNLTSLFYVKVFMTNED